MMRAAFVPLAGVLLFGAGCKGPNHVDGKIGDEAFPEVREAIFVGDADSDSADLKILMATYNNACTNYDYYVRFQQYDADNALLDEADSDPRYLLFTLSLEGMDPFAENPIVEPGGLIGDGPSFITGRYRFADGAGQFDEIPFESGTLTLSDFNDDGNLEGEFTVELTGGDSLTGGFEAVECDL